MPGEDHVTQNELFLFDIETLEGTVIDEGEDAWTDQTYSIPTVRAVTRHSLRFLLVVRSAEFSHTLALGRVQNCNCRPLRSAGKNKQAVTNCFPLQV